MDITSSDDQCAAPALQASATWAKTSQHPFEPLSTPFTTHITGYEAVSKAQGHPDRSQPDGVLNPSSTLSASQVPALVDNRLNSMAELSCHECGLVIKSHSLLNEHAFKTGHTPYVCILPACGASFTRVDSLTRHSLSHQNGTKLYECPHCHKHTGEKAFKRKDHLMQHIRGYHNIGIEGTSKPFSCPHIECEHYRVGVYAVPRDGVQVSTWAVEDHAFRSRKAFQDHMRKAHNETPYQCLVEHCDRRGAKGWFRERDLLTHQQKEHGGVQMSIGSSTATLPQYFQAHVRSDSGLRHRAAQRSPLSVSARHQGDELRTTTSAYQQLSQPEGSPQGSKSRSRAELAKEAAEMVGTWSKNDPQKLSPNDATAMTLSQISLDMSHPRPLSGMSMGLPSASSLQASPQSLSSQLPSSTNITTPSTVTDRTALTPSGSVNEDEEHALPLSASRTDRRTVLIDLAIEKVHHWLSACIRQRAPSESNKAPTGQSCPTGTTSQSDNSIDHRPTKRKKSLTNNNEDKGEESGDEQRRLPKQNKTKNSGALSARLFACPFHKYKPEVFRGSEWRICAGPGWRDTNRVKDHLYQRHMLKLQCDRCGSLFSGLDQRREHLRQDEPCTKREIDATAIDEGISEETCRRLKKRNGLSKLSEHDKWIRIFRILFPNCVVDVETEPYYTPERCTHGPSNFLRHRFVPEIRAELRAMIDDPSSTFGQQFNLHVMRAVEAVWTRALRQQDPSLPSTVIPFTSTSMPNSIVPMTDDSAGPSIAFVGDSAAGGAFAVPGLNLDFSDYDLQGPFSAIDPLDESRDIGNFDIASLGDFLATSPADRDIDLTYE